MNEEERLTFGQLMKRLRLEKGLSLREVEAKVGISNSYLYQIERGERNAPKPEVLRKFADLYGVSLASLLAEARVQEPQDHELYHQQLENAFEFVRRDKRFAFGTQMSSVTLPPEAKRFIIEAYQKATGTDLLGELKKVQPKGQYGKQK